MSLMFSSVCKAQDLEEDDVEVDEEEPDLEQDEAWLHKGPGRKHALEHTNLDEEALSDLRKKRKHEVDMRGFVKEIVTYTLFLWIFLTLSYDSRDPNAYILQRHLKNTFIREGNLQDLDFNLVTNTDRLWYFMHNGLLDELRVNQLYNDKNPLGLRGYLNDHANRIMGYGTIRQIRVADGSCRVPHVMRVLGRNCSGFTSIVNEESGDFCLGWRFPTVHTTNNSICKNSAEFKYSTAEELKSLPIWGERDWYGGGGYVIHLKGPTKTLLTKLHHLHANNWIDGRTRAVIIEFSAYNSQVNLFGTGLMMAEFTPGGGITPSYRFEGVRLSSHNSKFVAFVIFCEVMFCLFVVYFTLVELHSLWKLGWNYFRNYWSYAEIALLLACYLAITLYVLRYISLSEVMKIFAITRGNGYMKLQYTITINEYYAYDVAFIVFVGTIKLIKLLRFNKRMGVLSATLAKCWDDLSGFLMAFFLCFCTFVAMFYQMLNQYLEDFYNFITAVETCFSMMLGKFKFEEMKQANPIIPVMFFVFVVCNSWVLINLLLTLIIKAFQQVKHDLLNQPNEYEMVGFVWRHFKQYVGKGGPRTSKSVLLTKETSQDSKQDQTQQNVQEFPDKVDKFLAYLNVTYFDGTMNMHNKEALKHSMLKDSKVQNAE